MLFNRAEKVNNADFDIVYYFPVLTRPPASQALLGCRMNLRCQYVGGKISKHARNNQVIASWLYGKKCPADSWEKQPPDSESLDSHSNKCKTCGFPRPRYSSVLLTQKLVGKYKVSKGRGLHAEDELELSEFDINDEPDGHISYFCNIHEENSSVASYHQSGASFPSTILFVLETH